VSAENKDCVLDVETKEMENKCGAFPVEKNTVNGVLRRKSEFLKKSENHVGSMATRRRDNEDP